MEFRAGFQANKLSATEVGFFMGYVTRARQQEVQMGTIRASMDIGRNVLDVMKLRNFKMIRNKENARKYKKVKKNHRLGTRGKE